MGVRIFCALIVVMLAKLVVCEEKCTYPIEGLPIITEIYYQPWNLSPKPFAKVSFKTPNPILHHYWTVSDGHYDWSYHPEPVIYPVFNYYNGIMSHSQELGPNHHEYVLYSNHYLKKVRCYFVLHIGCNIMLYEIRYSDPARTFTSEVRPRQILKSPNREMISTEENEWIKWQYQSQEPKAFDVYYSTHDSMANHARRNGSRLLPFPFYPTTPAHRQDSVRNVEMKLKPHITEFMSSVRTTFSGVYDFFGYMVHQIPFSIRTEEQTQPAIAVDDCDPWTLANSLLKLGYYERQRRDDGVSTIVLKRRDDTHSCMRVHVNGNPFPEFEIKDMESNEVIPNWPFTVTKTYTSQLVATKPVAVGSTRNYQITARNSMGSITRQVQLVGYQETVVSSSPITAFFKGKSSVVLKCHGKGQFSKLGMYNATTSELMKDIYFPMKTTSVDAYNKADLSYRFTNFTAMGAGQFRQVFCALDDVKSEERPESWRGVGRKTYIKFAYRASEFYRYNQEV